MGLKVDKFHKLILTHQVTAVGPLPSIMDPDGVYPYQSYCETSDRPVLKKYLFIQLENNFLKVLICPDLGGKVYSIVHKKSEKEVLYVPGVIRQSRILPRFYFVAGGIEVSFPISHTPSQNEVVCYDIRKRSDRIYVCVGETEIRYGMQWTVEYSLGEHDHFLAQRTVFRNQTEITCPWMSWSNAALPAFIDSQFHFPNGKVLVHSDNLYTIDWEKEGPKTNTNIKKMSGYFWLRASSNAFGCFTPSRGIGLYHVADKLIVPGMKLWSYGTDRDLDWSFQSSLDKQSYLEIQAGPIADQSIKYELKPGETHHHLEFWIPSDKVLDIDKIFLPEITLRPCTEITMFPFARASEVKPWLRLKEAFIREDISQIPPPPSIEDANWPPSAILNLSQAFDWAIQHDIASNKPAWQLYYGIWSIGTDKVEEGILLLRSSGLDLALALLGRIYFYQSKFDAAIKCYEGIEDDALKLHPQVVVERDIALEKAGESAFQERINWLDRLSVLNDEMLIERRIGLLLDMGNFNKAKSLLLNTNFQKIHQRYARKKLWEKLCMHTQGKIEPLPENLGEDNLAQYGNYREFEG